MRVLNNLLAIAGLALTLSTTMASTAQAAGRTIWLNIVNNEDVPIRMEIPNGGNNCYEPEGRGALGTVRVIQPGGSYGWWINRVQGHGCDGENGQFVIHLKQNKLVGTENAPLKTSDGVGRSLVCFMYTNDLAMWINTGCANMYEGTFTKTAFDKYQFRTAGLTKTLKADAEPGQWDLICSNVCNRQTIATKSQDSERASSLSSEQTSAISVELSAGIEIKAFSASSTVTASQSQTLGRTMSSSVRSGSSFTDHSSFVYTPEQMRNFNIQAVWQWVVPVTLSSGGSKVIRSNYYTCTSGNAGPRYTPLDSQANGTCNGSLKQAQDNIKATLVGSYVQGAGEDPWFKGKITAQGNNFLWSNEAGVSWELTPDFASGILITGEGNPYAEAGHRTYTIQSSNGQVTGFGFAGWTFKKQ